MSSIADRVVAELARRYSHQYTRNPDFDRKAEREAWREGRDHDVPEFIQRTPEAMAGDTCTVVEQASDGCPSIRMLTYQEVADVVRFVEAAPDGPAYRMSLLRESLAELLAEQEAAPMESRRHVIQGVRFACGLLGMPEGSTEYDWTDDPDLDAMREQVRQRARRARRGGR